MRPVCALVFVVLMGERAGYLRIARVGIVYVKVLASNPQIVVRYDMRLFGCLLGLDSKLALLYSITLSDL